MATQWDALPRVLVDGESQIDWSAVGIQLLTHDPETGDPLTVKREKVEYKGALLLRVVDIDKARQHMGDEPIIAALDGSSFRVAQQDVNRSYLTKCATEKNKPIPTTLQHQLWNRLIGIRKPAEVGPRKPVIVTVEVVKIMLPNGTVFTPTAGDETPIEAQLMAAWLDALLTLNVPVDAARTMVQGMDFAGMIEKTKPTESTTK